MAYAPMLIGEKHDDNPASPGFRVRAFDTNRDVAARQWQQRRHLLQRLQRLSPIGKTVEFETFDWGLSHWEQHGQVVPDDFLDVLRPYDAILLGAVGWPETVPDHLTLAPLVKIRQSFDQYACVRPSRLYPGLNSVLAGKSSDDIDLVVIRENSEGEYVDNGGRFKQGQAAEVAVQTAIHTRRGVERILRFGFQMARTRRNHLTMITKSNAQRYAPDSSTNR